MEEITTEDLVDAAFQKEAWPEDLPMPGADNIRGRSLDDNQEMYRYQVDTGGQSYAMEVVLDRSSLANAAEGVTFMLNQFAYLWRTDKSQIQCAADGACRRINF